MKTKTTDGTTVVVATEQDRRTLDRAIDVLVEYKAREVVDSTAWAEASDAQESLVKIARRLQPAAPPENPAAKSDPKSSKLVPPENEVVKEGSVAPKPAKSAKSAK